MNCSILMRPSPLAPRHRHSEHAMAVEAALKNGVLSTLTSRHSFARNLRRLEFVHLRLFVHNQERTLRIRAGRVSQWFVQIKSVEPRHR